MATKRSRSSRGWAGFDASSSTRSLKSSQESSRLMKRCGSARTSSAGDASGPAGVLAAGDASVGASGADAVRDGARGRDYETVFAPLDGVDGVLVVVAAEDQLRAEVGEGVEGLLRIGEAVAA